MNKLSERLKELRVAKGVSQQTVSEYLGITQRAYSHYEIGDREPSISTLIKLCDLFDVSADYLIGRSDSY